MANYLAIPKKQPVLALLDLRWSYRGIESEIGILRETIPRFDVCTSLIVRFIQFPSERCLRRPVCTFKASGELSAGRRRSGATSDGPPQDVTNCHCRVTSRRLSSGPVHRPSYSTSGMSRNARREDARWIQVRLGQRPQTVGARTFDTLSCEPMA